MSQRVGLRGADAFRSAFRVEPVVAEESDLRGGVGIYAWKTPPIMEFALPKTAELILALHQGGSRRVHALTDAGLSHHFSSPGSLTLLPPEHASAFHTGGGVSFVTIHVPTGGGESPWGPYLARLAQWSAARFAFRDDYVRASVEALCRALRAGQPPSPEYVVKLVDALLYHLACCPREMAPPVEPLAPVSDRPLGRASLLELLRYVDQRLGRKLSLDELAEKAGVSRAYFARNFKDALGISLHQYLNRRRISAATVMLRDSDLGLADIAQETGFSSQSHFTDVFRSLIGTTPRQFRRRDA